MITNWKILVPLLILMLFYILLGGVIFHFVERDNEDASRELHLFRNREWLNNYPCVTEPEFWHLVDRLLEDYSKGVIVPSNHTIAPNWDFASSFFFATNLITTIGYGNVEPLTQAGRVFSVIYALIGVPLGLVVISGVGKSLARVGERTGGCSRTSCTCICLKGVMVIVLGVGFIVTLPALMYYKVEKRSFSDAWWFSFFTVTTVGLGEVPGKTASNEDRKWYRIVLAIWILIALMWLSVGIHLVVDAIYTKDRKVKERKIRWRDENGKVQALEFLPEDEHHIFTTSGGPLYGGYYEMYPVTSDTSGAMINELQPPLYATPNKEPLQETNMDELCDDDNLAKTVLANAVLTVLAEGVSDALEERRITEEQALTTDQGKVNAAFEEDQQDEPPSAEEAQTALAEHVLTTIAEGVTESLLEKARQNEYIDSTDAPEPSGPMHEEKKEKVDTTSDEAMDEHREALAEAILEVLAESAATAIENNMSHDDRPDYQPLDTGNMVEEPPVTQLQVTPQGVPVDQQLEPEPVEKEQTVLAEAVLGVLAEGVATAIAEKIVESAEEDERNNQPNIMEPMISEPMNMISPEYEEPTYVPHENVSPTPGECEKAALAEAVLGALAEGVASALVEKAVEMEEATEATPMVEELPPSQMIEEPEPEEPTERNQDELTEAVLNVLAEAIADKVEEAAAEEKIPQTLVQPMAEPSMIEEPQEEQDNKTALAEEVLNLLADGLVSAIKDNHDAEKAAEAEQAEQAAQTPDTQSQSESSAVQDVSDIAAEASIDKDTLTAAVLQVITEGVVDALSDKQES